MFKKCSEHKDKLIWTVSKRETFLVKSFYFSLRVGWRSFFSLKGSVGVLGTFKNE